MLPTKYAAAYAAVACITRNFFKTKSQWLINESGFKSRVAYNGAHTVCKGESEDLWTNRHHVTTVQKTRNKETLFYHI